MGDMLIAGALVALGSVAGAAISSSGASSVNADSQNFAAAQNQQAMDFSERMHNQTVQEGIQAEERADRRYIEQSQFNQGLQKEMLDYVFKNFNSPSAQAKALRAAGFNPSTLLGSSSSPFGNVPTPQSTGTSYNLGSTPAAPVGSSVGSPSLINPLSPFGDSVKSITSSLGDLAKANLDTSSSNRTEKLLELEVREKLLANKNAEIAFKHNALLLGIDKAFKSKKAAAELKHLVNSASLLAIQGKTEEANQDVLKLQKKLFEFQDKKNEAELPFLVQNAKSYADALIKQLELTKEKVSTERSIQAENYAGANLKEAQMKTENVLRGWKSHISAAELNRIMAQTGLSEQEITKGLAAAAQSADKRRFLDNNPHIKRIISVMESAADASLGAVLKGLFK